MPEPAYDPNATAVAAMAIAHLTPAMRRTLLVIEAGPAAQLATKVRSDVLQRLRNEGLVNRSADPQTLTDAGRAAAEHIRATQQPQTAGQRPVDVISALLRAPVPNGPQAIPGAVARVLLDEISDAERLAVVSWLASPDGAAYLGAVKDELIVGARPGRSHAEVAAYLGTSLRAVHKAVTRANTRPRPAADGQDHGRRA